MVLALASIALACTVVTTAQTTVTFALHNGTVQTCGATASNCVVWPGDTITATASSGVTGSTRFNLHFLNYSNLKDTMDSCMGLLSKQRHGVGTPYGDEKIGGPTTSTTSGTIGATSGVIPAEAKTTTVAGVAGSTNPATGKAFVCFIEAFPSPNDSTDYNGQITHSYAVTVM